MRPETPKRTRLHDLLLGACLIAPLIYAVITRTREDFAEYMPQINLALLLLGYAFFFSRVASFRLRFGRPPKGWKLTRDLLLLLLLYIPAFSVVAGLVYYGLAVTLKDLYFAIENVLPAKTFSLVATIAFVLLAGFVLFGFRLVARFHYGLTEALVGVVVAVHKIPADISDPVFWSSDVYLVMLTAGVYLVVRGLDNMHAGLKTDLVLQHVKHEVDEVLARLNGQARSEKSGSAEI